MKYTIALLLLLILAGCGLCLPAHATGVADTWPIFYTTENAGPDNGLIALYDQNATAWQQKTIDTDLVTDQWTPQRNAIGWDTSGKWNVSFIENTGNDLELWESPDTQWQDDAGAWAMTDAEASNNYGSVDIETRQNYLWSLLEIPAAGTICAYIDLSAGGPAWTLFNSPAITMDNSHYSIVLDNNLAGFIHWGYVITDEIYRPISIGDIFFPAYTVNAGGEFPQVIADIEDRIWYFYTTANTLILESSLNQPLDPAFDLDGTNPVYTANSLTSAHHSTWRKIDDTIHTVLVDFDDINPNSTYLIYLRRTPNGWTTAQTLLTVDSDPIGDQDKLVFPQICSAVDGSLFVSFIREDTVAPGGDLQGFYLDAEDYDNYTTIGAGGWILHTNIDGSATEVWQAVMPDYIPISGKI